jgi:hypothetical protein
MCYVDWKGCDKTLSRTDWSTMWIRTDDRECCHDLIWGALWIGSYSVIMLSRPNLKCYVDRKGCDRKISLSIRSTIWIITHDKGWCHDLNFGDIRIGTDVICYQIKFYVDWKEWDRKLTPPIWSIMWISSDETWWCLDLIWGAQWLEQRWNNAVMT